MAHSASLRPTEQPAKPVVSLHTPGEWTPKFAEQDDCWRIMFDVNGVPTGWLGVVYVDADPVTAEADARLISAAPDFLTSARSLIDAWDARMTVAQQIVTGRSDRDLQKQAAEAMDGLRAAIAKATAASSVGTKPQAECAQ